MMLAGLERRHAAFRGRVDSLDGAGVRKRKRKREIEFKPLSGPSVVGRVVAPDGTVVRPGEVVDESACPFARPFDFGSREKGTFLRRNKACGRCWYCTNLHVNQRVGLAMSEAMAAKWFMSFTLTFAGPDKCPARIFDRAEQHLQIELFQAFEKRLRQMYAEQLRGMGIDPLLYPLRLVKCGEKGGDKGRSHFHNALWGEGPPPDFRFRSEEWMFDPNNPQAVNDFIDLPAASYSTRSGRRAFGYKRAHIAQWPHGFVQIDLSPPDAKTLRYLFKYLQKGRGHRAKKYHGEALARGVPELPSDREAWVSTSRRPHLGIDQVRAMASQDASLGIFRRSFAYMPEGCSDALPIAATDFMPGRKGKRYTLPQWAQRTYIIEFSAACGVDVGQLPELIPRQVDEYLSRKIAHTERWMVQRSERSPSGDRAFNREYRRDVAGWRLANWQASADRWRPSEAASERHAADARRRAKFSGDPEIFDELSALDRAATERETQARFRAAASARAVAMDDRARAAAGGYCLWPRRGALDGLAMHDLPAPVPVVPALLRVDQPVFRQYSDDEIADFEAFRDAERRRIEDLTGDASCFGMPARAPP